MENTQINNLVAEIESVKRLLILQLIMDGAKQKDIARMLDVSEATMSRMIPKGITRKGS